MLKNTTFSGYGTISFKYTDTLSITKIPAIILKAAKLPHNCLNAS